MRCAALRCAMRLKWAGLPKGGPLWTDQKNKSLVTGWDRTHWHHLDIKWRHVSHVHAGTYRSGRIKRVGGCFTEEARLVTDLRLPKGSFQYLPHLLVT